LEGISIVNGSIQDFNDQWGRYGEKMNEYYESEELLGDILGPLLVLDEIGDKEVADVGAGNGRFTEVLARRAKAVVSIEPAEKAMANNELRNRSYNNVSFVRCEAERMPFRDRFDYVFCIGVLHHIPDMREALKSMAYSLKSDGTLLLWVYGREGNGLYLAFSKVLRVFTTRMSDNWLHRIAGWLLPALKMYRFLCGKISNLPLADYCNNHLAKLGDEELRLIIFDQLNPSVAYYLTREQIKEMVAGCGLVDMEIYHRHGYSWSVKARKP